MSFYYLQIMSKYLSNKNKHEINILNDVKQFNNKLHGSISLEE